MGHLEEQKAEVRANFEAFMAALPRLVAEFEGQYVVLRHAKIVDIFDSFGKAVEYCGAAYEDRIFSIQEITAASLEPEGARNAVGQGAIRP